MKGILSHINRKGELDDGVFIKIRERFKRNAGSTDTVRAPTSNKTEWCAARPVVVVVIVALLLLLVNVLLLDVMTLSSL